MFIYRFFIVSSLILLQTQIIRHKKLYTNTLKNTVKMNNKSHQMQILSI